MVTLNVIETVVTAMGARQLIGRLADWLGDPGVITYQCRSCGTGFDSPESECPECGGEVEELILEPSPPYVGPMG